MIVSSGEVKLLVIIIDVISDNGGRSKIHGSSLYGCDLSGGNGLVIGGGELISFDLNLITYNGSCFESVEIEVGVIGRIQNGILITASHIVKLKFVIIGYCIGNRKLLISGESQSCGIFD